MIVGRRLSTVFLGTVILVVIILWMKASNDGLQRTGFQEGIQLQPSGKQAEKVKVSVFYEVLCPDSISFIAQQLWPNYMKLKSVFDIELVPYGKASYTPSQSSFTFQCQHGPRECQGNKIHACALHLYNINKSLPFVHCSMSSSDPVSSSQKCADSNSLNWQQIADCSEGELGNNLLHANGVRTENLKPRMVFVPWILINDVYNAEVEEQALNDLLSVICNAYKGPKPAECHVL